MVFSRTLTKYMPKEVDSDTPRTNSSWVKTILKNYRRRRKMCVGFFRTLFLSLTLMKYFW